MKLGIICDSHMPFNRQSAQWQFCLMAAEQFKKDGIRKVITLGDITSFGEPEALDAYLDIFREFEHHWVLGNSDVRDAATRDAICEKAKGFLIEEGGVRLLGINTPDARISPEDREKLAALKDGDFAMMHHPSDRMPDAESRDFMRQLCEEKAITVIYGHLHRKLYDVMGKAKRFGMRAVDPDKSFGDWPCVTYFDTETCERTEVLLKLPESAPHSAAKLFGISCVDNHRDVAYAAEKGLYGVALRCNGKHWEPDLTLLPKLEAWRKAGGKYLSIHMPNLHWKDGQLQGAEVWRKAVEYARAVKADGMTIHPPRAKCRDMAQAHDAMMEQYVYVVENVPEEMNIGIENLHLNKGEEVSDRAFGYVPEEVAAWIDEINAITKRKNPVGHTLDVGHARNNGPLASKFPVSRWYEMMGSRAVAYHIHQVVQIEKGLKNHQPIELWFGPQISYVAFFCQWQQGKLNHAPIFLEVKGAENFEKSIQAFRKAFG